MTAIQNKKVDFSAAKGFIRKNEINQNNIIFSNLDNASKANDEKRKSILSSEINSINPAGSFPDFLAEGKSDSTANNQMVFLNKPSLQTADTSLLVKDIANKSFAATQIISLKRKKRYFITAGVGVQQQVPLAGQRAVAYGYNANENMLSDYIPSVYFRFKKNRKWFLQGEFIYRAPEFAYNRQTLIVDSGTATTNALNLKKTFANKIPVTFNYYLRPGWSAGAGIVYSVFQGAIAEKQITTKNTQTPAE